MALQIQETTSRLQMPSERFRTTFRAIATDVHFWIPFSVLIGGLFLLDKLR
jgi:hypothetical protein